MASLKVLTIPKLFPALAEVWELRPARAPTQHKEAARDAMWWISGYAYRAPSAYPPTSAAPGTK